MATPVPLLSFDFLGCPLCSGEGVGAIPAFLEFSSSRDPAGVQLPRLCGVPLHAQCPFPSFSSLPAWMRRGNHVELSPGLFQWV